MKKNLVALAVTFALAAFNVCQTEVLRALEPAGNPVPAAAQNAAPKKLETLTPKYATQFYLEKYERGYERLHVEGEGDFVLVPKGAPKTDLGLKGARVLQLPIVSVYVAASAAIDLIEQVDSIACVSATSSKAADFVNREIAKRVLDDSILYVGKYNAPDYEALLGLKCDLALVSTMIYHTPKTKERLEELGIPVFVERANYEDDPLGRLEWIKVYGALFGQEKKAEAYFDAECAKVDALVAKIGKDRGASNASRKSVAFFYVSSNGYVNVRKAGEFVNNAIKIAGGRNALESVGTFEKGAAPTVNLDWEEFYRLAVDADVLVYNGAVDSDVTTLSDLLATNPIFKDFKAVKSGNVYRADPGVYQQPSKAADTIADFYNVLNGNGKLKRSGCLSRLD